MDHTRRSVHRTIHRRPEALPAPEHLRVGRTERGRARGRHQVNPVSRAVRQRPVKRVARCQIRVMVEFHGCGIVRRGDPLVDHLLRQRRNIMVLGLPLRGADQPLLMARDPLPLRVWRLQLDPAPLRHQPVCLHLERLGIDPRTHLEGQAAPHPGNGNPVAARSLERGEVQLVDILAGMVDPVHALVKRPRQMHQFRLPGKDCTATLRRDHEKNRCLLKGQRRPHHRSGLPATRGRQGL